MRFSLILAATVLATSPAFAEVKCGGTFSSFISDMKAEAISKGYSKSTVNQFFANARQDPRTIKADRSQGIFRMSFLDFSRRVISQNRMDNGRKFSAKLDSTFDAIERKYGVSRGVLLAFWALETDYGQVQGDFNTLNSLLTLSHDCRRPELFQPQVFAALELYERGNFDPVNTQGAWAGEIGMVQMLPEDILNNGVDGDGDGKVSLKTSRADALYTGASMLRSLGWNPNEPWMQEVIVPANLDWTATGLTSTKTVNQWAKLGVKPRAGWLGAGNMQASILLPMGRKGPAFITYPNFKIYFEWNKSFVYVTSAAYFATRLEGAPVYNAGNADPALSDAEMKALQKKLKRLGHDVGKVDGILGAKTRAAVQKEQIRLGIPADAWPTVGLLGKL
ncbi:MAG: lytic transglycosylase [Marinosulfonomonas sp.]|nr:MAG: lytic transglycosylase [Marinosulfonomonas sp.]